MYKYKYLIVLICSRNNLAIQLLYWKVASERTASGSVNVNIAIQTLGFTQLIHQIRSSLKLVKYTEKVKVWGK